MLRSNISVFTLALFYPRVIVCLLSRSPTLHVFLFVLHNPVKVLPSGTLVLILAVPYRICSKYTWPWKCGIWIQNVRVCVKPGLLLVVIFIKYTSVSCKTSLPHYVPYLCQKKSLQWKRNFGYQPDIVKILLKLWELLGVIICVWDVWKLAVNRVVHHLS